MENIIKRQDLSNDRIIKVELVESSWSRSDTFSLVSLIVSVVGLISIFLALVQIIHDRKAERSRKKESARNDMNRIIDEAAGDQSQTK